MNVHTKLAQELTATIASSVRRAVVVETPKTTTFDAIRIIYGSVPALLTSWRPAHIAVICNIILLNKKPTPVAFDFGQNLRFSQFRQLELTKKGSINFPW